jgi:uncharacterized protein DUF7009
MKLRIKGDSLRLRLTQGEVQALDERGVVEDRVRFGDGAAFIYRLTLDRHSRAIAASFVGGVMEVRLPEQMALSWCRSSDVTLAGAQSTAADVELRIVVEKDFACLTPREGEDESDNFPNPNRSC